MADEFQLGSGNWWESSTPRNRYETTVGSTTASTSSLASSFGWPTEIADMKARSSMESGSVSGGGGGGAAAGGLLPDPSFQMMDLTLSSQALDWNQALFRAGEKGGESSFRSMLQEEASSGTFQHHQQQQHNQQEHDQWNRHNKIYSGSCDQESTRSLSLEQSHDFSPNMSTGSNHPNFQLDSSVTYGNSTNSPPPNHVLQGLLVSDHHNHAPMNYTYTNYGGGGGGGGSMNAAADHQFMAAGPPSWGNNSNKFPQFLRNSPPPKQPPPAHGGQLHFSNNTPFWNASSASMNDIRPSLFPSLQSPITLPNFEEKTKNSTEARDLGMAKKSGNETSAKRARSDTPSTPMPAFKVRKEKMGDRITALQQLVSPFGKTDTASVLSEAIEYIKFLHEQVSALSTPYMKSGAPMTVITHQQNIEKSKEGGEGPKQDLRSRGLCLVPVSSTFPVTHETTVDFWTPRLGGTFR